MGVGAYRCKFSFSVNSHFVKKKKDNKVTNYSMPGLSKSGMKRRKSCPVAIS